MVGENEEKVVLIHGRKAGVMLRAEALEKWVEGETAEMIGREGGSTRGCRVTEIGVSVPAELGGGWRGHGEM